MTRWQKCLSGSVLFWLSGCQSLHYYGHSIKGQWQIISQRQAIPKVMANPQTSPKLLNQLQTIQNIRLFAASLGLPTKGQYDTYVDIHRPYAMWSVAATPELSLVTKTWCYWGVGCLGYRGFFEQTLAESFEQQLKQEGLDTYLSRVTAYSTLGWFRDSVLSSFINKSENELAELLFHELAHQVVYAKGDAVFNESFADVVAEEGLRRYLVGRADGFQQIVTRKKRQQQFAQLVLDYRQQLHQVYRSKMAESDKRAQKKSLFLALNQSYQQLKDEQWQGYKAYDAWFAELSNAKLNSVSVYNELMPALNVILKAHNDDLPTFYNTCKRLAKLSKSERHRILNNTNPDLPLSLP
ncbi:MAG: aminopeptidase [Agitococcus sp.]|nr:aminopeptidase [Agitococcus sp.]